MTRTRIGSDAARAWVRSLRLGNPYAKSILMAVANYVNDDGTAFPGIATLHLDTEIAENTIGARLRWCEEIGAVTLSKCWVDENGRRNREGRGRPTSSEIRFLIDADIEAIAEQAQQHTSERPLRGAAKQAATSPPREEPTPQTSPCPDEELNSASPSLAPQQPLTGAARIEEVEEERKQDSNPQTPFREKAERGFESKIDEEAEKRFEEFKVGYPQGILDLAAARKEFTALADGDQKDCIRSLPIYADRLRGRGRHPEKSMKAHIFIRKRGWDGLLASQEARPDAPSNHPSNSLPGRAILALGRVARYRPLELNGKVIFRGDVTPQLLALANVPPDQDWGRYEIGSPHLASWRELIQTAFKGCSLPELTMIDAPWPWPPRKDGSINLGTTDPPKGLSDEDARALAGM